MLPVKEKQENRKRRWKGAADLMQAGDFQGPREALDEARQWENEIDERRNLEGFMMYRD